MPEASECSGKNNGPGAGVWGVRRLGEKESGWEGPGKLLGFILGENKRRKVGVGEGTGVAA